MKPCLAVLSLLALPAPAAAATRVFVEPFRAFSSDQQEEVEEFTILVWKELAKDPDLEIITLDAAPPVHDQTARMYLDSCRKDEPVGCLRTVADVAGAAYAITGEVRIEDDVLRVEVVLIEVGERGRQATDIPLTLEGPVDEADRLAAHVRINLDDYLRGRLDIRKKEQDGPSRYLDAQELKDLESDDALRKDIGRNVRFTRRSRASLDEEARLEAQKARQGLVMIRGDLGGGLGPVDNSYLGRTLLDPDDASVEDATSWQVQEPGAGWALGVGVGYGLEPGLEAEVGVSRLAGTCKANIGSWTGWDDTDPEEDVQESGCGNLLVQAGVRWLPFPMARWRPMATGGLAWLRGADVERYAETAFVYLPAFAPVSRLGLQGSVGVETSLSPRLDAWAAVPVLGVVGSGQDVMLNKNGIITQAPSPPDAGHLGAGIRVGIQARLGRW